MLPKRVYGPLGLLLLSCISLVKVKAFLLNPLPSNASVGVTSGVLPVCGNSRNWMGSGANPLDCKRLVGLFKTDVINLLENQHEEFEFLGEGFRVTRPLTFSTPLKFTHGELRL